MKIDSILLEHISIEGNDRCTELGSIFDQNPNIIVFSANIQFIWENRDWILKSGIKLNRFETRYRPVSDINFDQVCAFLNELHERRFYRRLNLTCHDSSQEAYHQLTSLCALERLALFPDLSDHFILQPLTTVSDFLLSEGDIEISEMLAKNLINVQRISIRGFFITFDIILPFIRHCPKLQQIRFRNLFNNNGIIDLSRLNKERMKLSNAKSTKIFIKEITFLEYRWKQGINLSLIELKRDSEWPVNDSYFKPGF